MVIMLELPRAALRFIYIKKNDEEYIRKVVSTVFTFGIISSLSIILLLYVFKNWLLIPFLNNIPFYPYILYVFLSIPFGVVFLLSLNYVSAMQQGYRSFWMNNIWFLLNISFNLLFVAGMKMDIAGMLLSSLIANMIMAAYAFFTVFRFTFSFFRMSLLKEMMLYALPLIPYSLFGLLMDIGDNFIINGSIGASTLGIYYIAFTFAGVFAVIKESVSQAFTPYYFDKYNQENKLEMNKIIYHVVAAVGFAAIGVSWFNHEVLLIFSRNPDLVTAHKYIPIITLGYFAIFISQMVNLPVYYEKKNVKLLFLSTLAALTVNLSLSLLLVHRWGILGTSIAKLIAFIIHMIVTIIINRKKAEHHFSWVTLASVFVVTGIFSLMAYLPINFIWLLALKILLVSLLSLIMIKYFDKEYDVIEKVRVLAFQKLPFIRKEG